MRRLNIFLIILIIAIGSLLGLVAVSLYLSATTPSYYQSSWMNQMWQSMGVSGSTGSGNNGGMGGMMGGNGTTTTTTTNLWIIPVAIISAAIIGIIGFSFYMVIPEIRNTRRTCEPTKTSGVEAPISNVTANSCEARALEDRQRANLRTAKPEPQPRVPFRR